MKTNSVIDLINSHRSIRAFTNESVTAEQINLIVEAGRWAPTSHHVQAYSIIVVKDKEKKEQLAELAGNQSYVESCPVFFVIVADYYRLKQASDLHNESIEIKEQEQIIVGAVDAALVAQNMLLAARSLDLGGVMIGGIRNDLKAVAELLELPEYTFPVMGLCIGYPAQNPDQKPRLPQEAVVHYDKYDQTNMKDALDRYDQIMKQYYLERTNGKRADLWTKQMASFLSTPKRPEVEQFLKQQGFLK
ncbi:oxygen-insensitive NADPH nitroreductase [Halalkalibacter akibai]|uniref:Nitro/flavin reductase n=1 Tax=Halalkalibacter akibai (strain ATCC 43226 / DSM 21942 / CIP 109018 / JCM 9157 / 1139) TaxID=1236973 RepID=W4QZB5_HALA3|nr:oxygen-insensitive NADPH nitroreductase [Halalkalibacter akibai]GAE37406.1 nitro/flavin reductase [Halalkalibacter akibai JCM 9157]